MSITIDQTMDRIRWLLNDVESPDYAVSTPRLYRLLMASAAMIAQRVPTPLDRVTGAVTLVAGTRDYSLPSSATYYERVIDVIRHSDLRPLARLSLESMANQVFAQRRGPPESYCLIEDSVQGVLIRVDPIPTAADTLDLLRGRMLTTLDDATILSGSTEMGFSPQLSRALEKHVAATFLVSATEEQRAKIGLSPDIAAVWFREVERSIKDERVRLARLRRLSTLERVEA